MSGLASFALGTAVSPFLNQAEAFISELLFVRTQRGFATKQDFILPDCVIEEIEQHELEITQHPIETGAEITDHAFKRPQSVTVRYSWSNSANANLGGTEDYVSDVWVRLLQLQEDRGIVTLFTGKTMYVDMMIASLSQTTNAESEYALNTVIVFKRAIFVSTQATAVPDAQFQRDPSQTSPVSSTGSKSTSPLAAGQQQSIARQYPSLAASAS